MGHGSRYDACRSGYDERRRVARARGRCERPAPGTNVSAIKKRANEALGPLLADAGLLLFEYDADGFIVGAVGSCLGGNDPMLEVRSGLVSPEVVRRAAAGKAVTVQLAIGRRRISVKHEPVRGAAGEVERIVATAIDVTKARARGRSIPTLLKSLPSAS